MANQHSLQVQTSYKEILTIALPIAAAILVPQINFITNNIFLGKLGERELALAGITGIFYLIFAVIGQGLNTGLQSLIARKAGENNAKDIASYYKNGIRIALCTSIGGILFVWLFAGSVLQWAMHDKDNVPLATEFLRIRIFGLPFLYMYLMRNSLLVGINQSRFLIIGTATEALVNIFFDYVLINGVFGFPKLGFYGAAYASIIAELVAQFAVFMVLKYNKRVKHLQLFKIGTLSKSNVLLILNRSSPIIMQYTLSIVSWEIFYLLIEHHGERALAVSNTMRNIFGFFGCFTWAFAATTNTMVSNILGQKKEVEVFSLIGRIIRLSITFSISVATLVNLFPEKILAIYGQSEGFIADAIPVIRVVSVAMLLMSVSVVWLNSVTGTGKTKVNLAIEFVAIILYLIYSFVVLEVMNLPINWGWGSEWIYWTSLLIPSYWFMKSQRWKNI